MSLSDETWVDMIGRRSESVMKMLKERDYTVSDFYDLANAELFEQVPPDDDPSQLVDDSGDATRLPPAEIIAAARYVQFANLTLDMLSLVDHDQEMHIKNAYLLGKLEVEFRVYMNNPGKAGSLAADMGSLPNVFGVMDQHAKSEMKRQLSLVAGRKAQAEKEKENCRPRDEKICEIGKLLKSRGVTDTALTQKVIIYMFKHDINGNRMSETKWKFESKEDKNLWEYFGEPTGMTPPTVLKILRDGKVRS